MTIRDRFPVRLTVSLTREVADQLDASLEEGEARITLIREAIKRELQRRARKNRPSGEAAVQTDRPAHDAPLAEIVSTKPV